MFRLGLSAALHRLEPSLPVVTRDVLESFDSTIFLVSEDALWIERRARLLRPMFVNNEDEARRAIDFYRSQIDLASAEGLPLRARTGRGTD